MFDKDYDNYRKAKFESALLFQDFVIDLFYQVLGWPIVQYASKAYQQTIGETKSRVEIKHDEKFSATRNLYIEIEEKARPRPGDYVPAGIYRNDNAIIYVIGDYNTIYVFSKGFLQALAESGRYPIIPNRYETSRGFLLKEEDAEKYAIVVLKPNAATKILKITQDAKHLAKVMTQAVNANPAQKTLFPYSEVEK